ncbi:hypothetical protein [Candidatus Nitrospira bockiana]
MTTTHHFPSDSESLEGRLFRPASPQELAEAIEQAFDYRGDVTLELRSGAKLEGFVFNRDSGAAEPFLELYPVHEAGMRRVPYAEVAAIAFTGKDTASGKSWEAWVAKKDAQRRAEAEQAAADARARGHL